MHRPSPQYVKFQCICDQFIFNWNYENGVWIKKCPFVPSKTHFDFPTSKGLKITPSDKSRAKFKICRRLRCHDLKMPKKGYRKFLLDGLQSSSSPVLLVLKCRWRVALVAPKNSKFFTGWQNIDAQQKLKLQSTTHLILLSALMAASSAIYEKIGKQMATIPDRFEETVKVSA